MSFNKPPLDWDNPKWFNGNGKAVHEWTNYADDDLRRIWDTFTREQKRIISKNLEDIAMREEWE